MALTVVANVPTIPLAVFSQFVGTIVASGGTAPYTYTDTGGTLPPDLSIDSATGDITGQLTKPGTYFVSIDVTDSVADTGNVTFQINVVAPLPDSVRTKLAWTADGCLVGGREMARVIFDAVKTPNMAVNIQGAFNQPFGLIKSLIYNIKFRQVNGDTAGSNGMSLDVQAIQNLMRVTFGVPADMFGSNNGFIADAMISGAVPFYCDSISQIKIDYNPGANSQPNAVEVMLFFCNFEVPPYTLSCVDNFTD